MIIQKEIILPAFTRGIHLITHLIEKEAGKLPQTGVMHVFIKHTSAGLTLNENCDPDVRVDMNRFMDHLVPENLPLYTHTAEGPDDMPAHLKSTLFGSSISIPISDSGLNLGTWQGIYLGEFRNNGGRRKIVITIMGAG